MHQKKRTVAYQGHARRFLSEESHPLPILSDRGKAEVLSPVPRRSSFVMGKNCRWDPKFGWTVEHQSWSEILRRRGGTLEERQLTRSLVGWVTRYASAVMYKSVKNATTNVATIMPSDYPLLDRPLMKLVYMTYFVSTDSETISLSSLFLFVLPSVLSSASPLYWHPNLTLTSRTRFRTG